MHRACLVLGIGLSLAVVENRKILDEAAAFARQPVALIELIIGAAIGGLLGLSASLGEVRRKRPEK